MVDVSVIGTVRGCLRGSLDRRAVPEDKEHVEALQRELEKTR
jgi:hypothetical protein